MDFSLSDDQQAIASLAEQILRDGASHERLRALERSAGPRFDRALWQRLAEAGLLGIAVPEARGGAGLGFLEIALVVEQVGRTAAPVPLLETVVLGALPIVRFGSPQQHDALLPSLVTGEVVWTAALGALSGDPASAVPTARADGDGWVLEGSQACVPAGAVADRVLVLAQADAGPLVLLVDPSARGVTRTALETTSGRPDAHLDFAGVRIPAAGVLGAPGEGEAIAAWIGARADAALAALALGVCAEALRQTAEYVKERQQFGQPIAMFQAVAHRAADAYIDVEAVRLTTWQAASRLAADEPAAEEIALAKFWACEGGHRVVHAAQHLHGGMGVDRDYPLHRYFLLARQLMLTMGGPTTQLLRIGRALADTPA